MGEGDHVGYLGCCPRPRCPESIYDSKHFPLPEERDPLATARAWGPIETGALSFFFAVSILQGIETAQVFEGEREMAKDNHEIGKLV